MTQYGAATAAIGASEHAQTQCCEDDVELPLVEYIATAVLVDVLFESIQNVLEQAHHLAPWDAESLEHIVAGVVLRLVLRVVVEARHRVVRFVREIEFGTTCSRHGEGGKGAACLCALSPNGGCVVLLFRICCRYSSHAVQSHWYTAYFPVLQSQAHHTTQANQGVHSHFRLGLRC